jgi:PAS domain-containing protein
VLFFGVNVSCAQCHDHPHVADWSQEVYYGMKSFLDRTFDNGGHLAERDHGLVKYQTTAGDNREASVRFISGTTLEMPEPSERTDEIKKAEKEYFEKFKEEKKQPPPPENSLRRKLVETALSEGENIYLARATVNRIWGRLLGRGLVTPLDQMHSENPASHPELLEWLARDLVDHDFDTRRIVRGITLSEAYARESRRLEGESPAEELFAVAQTRVLSPFQYASSLKLAATKPERFAAETESQELEKRLEQIASAGRGLAREFEVPMDNFQVSVDEALLMTNSARIQGDLLAGGDKLTDELAKLESDEQRVNHAMRVILGRSPTEEEQTVLVGYLAGRNDRTESACQQLVWALLTSSEFRFNH